MAVYQYECILDGIFDYEYAIGKNPDTEICRVCGDTVRRKFSATPAIFRGGGWGGKS